MSRWTVNPISFVKNVREAIRLGATISDRLNYLGWLYNEKAYVRHNPSGKRLISMRLKPPVGPIRLAVRDNRGADQLVFGEVLIHRDYEIDLAPPATALDLGGNIGLATLYFAKRWPDAKLAVVEPVPDNVAMLRENLSLNGAEATVFANAVGAQDSTVSIALAELDCAHHIGEPTDTGRGSLKVEALSIPTLLARLGWDRIGLLKVDIEGYEAVLLRHQPDWLNRVDAMCLEAFDNTIGADELRQIAKRYGFRVAVRPCGIYVWTRN